MAEWTHRICERCWFDGPLSEMNGGIRTPVQVKEIEAGVCCYCGGLTITGIFTRANETTVLCHGRHDPSLYHLWAKVDLGPAPLPRGTGTGEGVVEGVVGGLS